MDLSSNKDIRQELENLTKNYFEGIKDHINNNGSEKRISNTVAYTLVTLYILVIVFGTLGNGLVLFACIYR
jgi:hypothetical protein